MAELKALCMKCRQKGKEHQMQVMTDINVLEKEGKGGAKKYSAKGKCAVCGTGMFKFLSKEDAAALK
ncbi:MAG: hypothetical protein NUW02_02240 [Candidatus Campbellbacteria bacterium]|nr:hypothetical protein [Candidatus Campbellbacteria bacterium]